MSTSMSTSAPGALGHLPQAPPWQGDREADGASRRWPRRLLTTTLALLAAVGLLLATGGARRIDPAAPGAAGRPGDGAAATAVTGLVAPGGSDPLTAVPGDFGAVMGYTPTPVRFADGTVRMVKPDGACSVPGGGTRFGFETACKAHDYGYDLLRYATATGQRLTGDARKLVDGMFARDLHAHCRASWTGVAGLGCQATAEVFAAGTGINSWRQGYGSPGKEPVPLWAFALALPVVAGPVAAGARRRRRGHRPGGGRPALDPRRATAIRG